MNPEKINFDSEIESDFYSSPEPIFADLDNEGIYDSIAQLIDTDSDGQPDSWLIQSDLNNDGIADQTSIIQGVDTDNDGQADTWQIQTELNNDGVADDVTFYQDTDDVDQPDTLMSQLAGSFEIIGEPANDMEHWHQQTYQDTCAVTSQEFILDELTGQDFSEDELRQEALENGWYTPGGGTPMDCVGNLLEAHGIDVKKDSGCTWEDLNQQLANGQKVIVGVDAEEIWSPGGIDEDDWLASFMGMPGQGANHAVEVIGIDRSEPNNPMVILNDPGTVNGQGLRVPAGNFMDAWEDSGNFMVHTTGQAVNLAQQDLEQQPMLGGYYNADGTYHWESDNTDRDPQTGVIIRQW